LREVEPPVVKWLYEKKMSNPSTVTADRASSDLTPSPLSPAIVSAAEPLGGGEHRQGTVWTCRCNEPSDSASARPCPFICKQYDEKTAPFEFHVSFGCVALPACKMSEGMLGLIPPLLQGWHPTTNARVDMRTFEELLRAMNRYHLRNVRLASHPKDRVLMTMQSTMNRRRVCLESFAPHIASLRPDYAWKHADVISAIDAWMYQREWTPAESPGPTVQQVESLGRLWLQYVHDQAVRYVTPPPQEPATTTSSTSSITNSSTDTIKPSAPSPSEKAADQARTEAARQEAQRVARCCIVPGCSVHVQPAESACIYGHDQLACVVCGARIDPRTKLCSNGHNGRYCPCSSTQPIALVRSMCPGSSLQPTLHCPTCNTYLPLRRKNCLTCSYVRV